MAFFDKQLTKSKFVVENVHYGDTNGIPQKLKKVVLGGAGGHAQFWSLVKIAKKYCFQIYA